MEFFNKKEEVLQLELTEYGKYLLSLGKMRPKYYGFFDDEILYDSRYEISGTTETQNDVDRRIRYETPNLKVIPTRSGAETRVARFQEVVSSSLASSNSDPADLVEAFNYNQPFEDKANFATFPLGTSAITTQYAPAWHMQLLNKNSTVISSSLPYIVSDLSSSNITGSTDGIITQIPQLNIDLDYEIYFTSNLANPKGISQWVSSSVDNSTGPVKLALIDNYLVVDALEKNVPFEKDNYEVEVYYFDPEDQLVQLAFVNESSVMDAPNSLLDPTQANVEYYMNLSLDHNIPPGIQKDVGISSKRALRITDRVQVVRDLYQTEDEEPC